MTNDHRAETAEDEADAVDGGGATGPNAKGDASAEPDPRPGAGETGDAAPVPADEGEAAPAPREDGDAAADPGDPAPAAPSDPSAVAGTSAGTDADEKAGDDVGHVGDVGNDEGQPPPTHLDRRTRTPSWVRFILLACALIVASSAALCTHRVLNPPLPAMSETVEVIQPQPSVVVSIRLLARLETATARVERVVDLRDEQSELFGLVQSEDAILLVAAGDVVAGVDLSELSDDSVHLGPDGSTTIELPAPTIFSARLDNSATYVHSRTTDLMARRSETLETRARREAERSLRDAALESGLLTRAGEQAQRTVESLLRSLGHTDVTVHVAEPQ